MTIKFTVYGEPKGQPRPRAFAMKIGGKYQARVFDAGTAEGWKSLVAAAMRDNLPETPFLGPISLGLTFGIKRPKSHFRTGKHADELRPDAPSWCEKKPDIDNYAKAVMDCITQAGGMWNDDSQVAVLYLKKEYSNTPGVQVTVNDL